MNGFINGSNVTKDLLKEIFFDLLAHALSAAYGPLKTYQWHTGCQQCMVYQLYTVYQQHTGCCIMGYQRHTGYCIMGYQQHMGCCIMSYQQCINCRIMGYHQRMDCRRPISGI
jgi:hypothetical protein